MKDHVIKFKVIIPDELQDEKLNDPDFPMNVRTVLVVDAINNLRAFVETKKYYSEDHGHWQYNLGDIESYKLDNGIEVSWEVEGKELPEPAPVPTPDPEPEPTPDPSPTDSDDPIRNFMAKVLNTAEILCTWDANKNGKMDIEFYRPGIDRKFIDDEWVDLKWKHSVEKYVGPIDISDQSEIIWLEKFTTVIARAKVEKKVLGITVSTWYSKPVMVHVDDIYTPEPEPDPEPVDPTPVPDPQPTDPAPVPDPEPEPQLGQTQIALNFLDGVNLDVTVNGILYPATDDFDYRWDNNGKLAGTKVVTVNGDFETMELNPDQIRKEGLNNDGWGAFCYKVVNKDAGANLYAINSRHDNSNQEFWGTAASTNAQGVIVSRMGSTVGWKDEQGNPIFYPDPLFYKGFQDQPKNNPDNRIFHPIWSKTGKLAISFFKYNENAENPVV